jgi:hypothetical protein
VDRERYPENRQVMLRMRMRSWQREQYSKSLSTSLQANQSFRIGSAGYASQFLGTYQQALTSVQEETAPPPKVKKPNPQNEKNKATLQELEGEVKRYVESSIIQTGQVLIW